MPLADQHNSNSVRNKIELRVIGQMRSGNHAVIEWLKSLYAGQSICFLNNIQHGDCDPYTANAGIETSGLMQSGDVEDLRRQAKDVLIYSYEDRGSLKLEGLGFLESVLRPECDAQRAAYIGRSQRQFDVYIVRDPFNCLASRLELLRKRGDLGGLDDIVAIKDNWKAIARKVKSISAQSSSEVVINYNRWLVDQDYKQQLANTLMASSQGEVPDEISSYGGGSSFEVPNHAPIGFGEFMAKSYKLLNPKRWLKLRFYLDRIITTQQSVNQRFARRWQLFQNDEEYLRLVADQELLDLSEAIFSPIPGTRALVRRAIAQHRAGVA